MSTEPGYQERLEFEMTPPKGRAFLGAVCAQILTMSVLYYISTFVIDHRSDDLLWMVVIVAVMVIGLVVLVLVFGSFSAHRRLVFEADRVEEWRRRKLKRSIRWSEVKRVSTYIRHSGRRASVSWPFLDIVGANAKIIASTYHWPRETLAVMTREAVNRAVAAGGAVEVDDEARLMSTD